jgi:non-ribosomal peptide synthase protein (TIGR01720 family)
MVIGFPAAGRSRRELEPLIGMFVNTVPIRLQIAEGASFASLLAQVKARTVDALSNQDVPFEKLVDELGVERSLSWSPVFQVMFITQQSRPAPALPAGLRAEAIPAAETGTTKFDLTLAIAEREDGLSLNLEYDTALFDAATIERFAEDYVGVLREGLVAPDLVIAPRGGSLDPPAVTGYRKEAVATGRVASIAPATPAEQALADIWRQVLRLDRVSVTDNFFEVGGDSIVSIQVIAQLRDKGWKIDPRQIFRHQTIRALAAVAEPVAASTAAVEEGSGPMPLTPMQRLFFDLNPPSPNHFNQSLLLTLAPDVLVSHLRAAIVETQRVHPALRSRFQSTANGWEQVVEPAPDAVFECHVVSGTSQVESICQAAQQSLDIVHGPVFRADMIDCGADGARLFLVAHHLVVDAVSWRVILADLESAYAQVRRGVAPSLPAEMCGPSAHRQLMRAWRPDEAETKYWDDVTASAAPLFTPPAPPSAASSPRTVVRTLAESDTSPLLGAAHRAYNTTTGDLLLAAYAKAVSAVAGRDEVLIDVEGHGRDALAAADLSRSVGWFTTLYPIRVSQAGSGDPATLIKRVKEANRSVPNGGLGFGLRQPSNTAPLTDVSFNFLGQTAASLGDGLFRALAPEPAGDPVAADLPRRYRIELNASIVEGRLVTQYGFDASVVPESRINELADRVTATLRELVTHCLSVEGAHYTPSDFAAVPIEQQELDALLSDLDLSGLSEA